MQFHYPFYFDARQRTAQADDEDHVRDMIEQYLFTNPGERVNRPDFGCGVMQLSFGANSPELAAALQFTVQAGLQRWLGDLIELERVEVRAGDPAEFGGFAEPAESRLTIAIDYLVRRTNERRTATFVRSGV